MDFSLKPRLPSFLGLAPVLVGALALAATGWLWQHERESQQRNLRGIFDLGVRQTASRIEERLTGYEQMLRGAQGLFAANDRIDREGFASFVDALRAGSDFIGLQAMAYAPRLGPEQLADHIAAQRIDGAPGYALQPPGPRAVMAPVTFTSPMLAPNQGVLGRDLYVSEPRRTAMQRAGDSGGIAITSRVSPINRPEGGTPGFVMFMPLYAKGALTSTIAARRANLVGWVLAGFNIDDMMSSLYGETTPGLALQIHDGIELTDDTLIYASGNERGAGEPARFEAQEYIGYAGHTWTLRLRTRPEFEQRYGDESARIILISGLGLSLLLTVLTWLLVNGRARAHETARAMTAELRASEARYRRIVETANEGIWLIDAEGRTSFVNPKLAQMLGHGGPSDDGDAGTTMIGRPLADFSDEAWPAVAGERDVRLRRRDGGVLWATLSTTPITGTDGRPAGMLAMVTDITDKKLAEARRGVLEAQLLESQKMEAIGTLAGGIAHDFNNILAAILGNAALAQQHLAIAHPARSSLDQIRVAGMRARSLVQQITAFSRREPQQLVNQPLRPLVEESVRLMRSTLPALVEIELVLTDTPLPVDADATQLQQVLLNLCTNAWHALQGSTGRIEIGLAEVQLDAEAAEQAGGLAPGAHADLWVADNGIGMDAATRAHIFEPFYTTKPVGQGTGLGLSVVHGIVTTHRGAITVASTPGQGSRFDVLLPLRQPLVAAGPVDAAAVELPHADGEHVLYVDDDAVMVTMVAGLLQAAGYRVTSFEDPRAALAAVRAAPGDVDLVVTDFNMPEVSGLDVAREIARIRPGLPVVVSSGYITDEMRAGAQQAGVRGLLQKEYTLEQLVGIVHRLLDEGS